MKIMLGFLGILGALNLVLLGGMCIKHFLSVRDHPQKNAPRKEE